MLAFLTLLPALAGPEVGAILRPEVVADLAPDRRPSTGAGLAEDVVTVHTWARAFVREETERNDVWFLEGRLQHHLLIGDDVEAYYELGLGETGWNGRLGGPDSPARLRVGVLRERWGKTDLLPVLDILNPADARVGPLTDPAFRRQPLPMAVLQLGKGSFRSETTIIPFAGQDRLWLRETDWSLIRQDMADAFITTEVNNPQEPWPGDRSETTDELIRSVQQNLLVLDPSLRRGQDAATNGDGLPQAIVGNGEIAQRFELTAPNVDVALMGGWLRSTFPQAVLDAELRVLLQEERLPENTGELASVQEAVLVGTPLDVTWPRTGVVGLEASGLLGDLQLRGEAGYWTDRVVRMAYGNSTTVPQLAAAVGVDYIRGSTFQATLEGRYQHLFDAPSTLVLARPDQVQIALLLRGSVLAERLQLTLISAYDASFNELLARPAVAWRVSDRLQLELGATLLEGFTTAPPAGLLDALTYEGGPVSYWSENDALTLGASIFL